MPCTNLIDEIARFRGVSSSQISKEIGFSSLITSSNSNKMGSASIEITHRRLIMISIVLIAAVLILIIKK